MRFRIVFPGLAQFPPMTRDWERQLDPDDLHRIAEILDRSAFDGIYVQEHIAIPQADVETFGARYLDALTAMAFLAGATRRLLLTSNVIVLPFHPPVAHAKAVASLDVMSGGRVIVCYGVGHFAAEFVAVGASYQHRGAVMDESLEVLKLLWTEDVPTYRSERFEIADLVRTEAVSQAPSPDLDRREQRGRHAPGRSSSGMGAIRNLLGGATAHPRRLHTVRARVRRQPARIRRSGKPRGTEHR